MHTPIRLDYSWGFSDPYEVTVFRVIASLFVYYNRYYQGAAKGKSYRGRSMGKST